MRAIESAVGFLRDSSGDFHQLEHMQSIRANTFRDTSLERHEILRPHRMVIMTDDIYQKPKTAHLRNNSFSCDQESCLWLMNVPRISYYLFFGRNRNKTHFACGQIAATCKVQIFRDPGSVLVTTKHVCYPIFLCSHDVCNWARRRIPTRLIWGFPPAWAHAIDDSSQHLYGYFSRTWRNPDLRTRSPEGKVMVAEWVCGLVPRAEKEVPWKEEGGPSQEDQHP